MRLFKEPGDAHFLNNELVDFDFDACTDEKDYADD